LGTMLRGAELARFESTVTELANDGIPAALALRTSSLLYQFMLLDVVQVAEEVGTDPGETAQLYFCVSERYQVDDFLTRISTLARDGRWKALARQALRGDLYAALASLTAQIARTTASGLPADQRLDEWEVANLAKVMQVRSTLTEIASLDAFDLASLSVALRALRTLVAQSQSAHAK